ncbi:MAG: hypothetical protein JWL81_1574, partial [Verrucomicrobiales bacterium]|nr:hypothetical protein [Verrucomicrobiales bacterium]
MNRLSSRREFLVSTGWGLAALGFPPAAGLLGAVEPDGNSGAPVTVLPEGAARAALEAGWFPNRMHAFIWRNQGLVAMDRLAAVLGCTEEEVAGVARGMGLEKCDPPGETLRRRSHLTIIRRNWHLLPYDQLLVLLGWSAEQLAYTLREDDFFFIKLGSLKPRCAPLRWTAPTDAEKVRAGEIARLVEAHFPQRDNAARDPLFSFIDKLKAPLAAAPGSGPKGRNAATDPHPPLRMGYSYFALCGDPLLDPALDPFPDGLLERLAAVGENAVWLHVELPHLSSVPWSEDANIQKRRAALTELAARAGRHGIKLFLYFNEPRALTKMSPVFQAHPDWRGVEENGYHAVCTSAPAVRDGLRDAVADLCRAVPDLGGFFTITASENLTHCWSHGQGAKCPRCREKSAGEVIAGVSLAIAEGIRLAGGSQRYLAWDWGWPDDQALDIIARLPAMAELVSVSEWALPINRGGVESTVGEYSISSIGPGPRARRHWEAARKRGLRVVAKIQCGNTWEMSAVPWLPVLENITRHATALREAGVNDIMLGWTLGCHPSPNLAAIDEIGSGGSLETLALRRHGPDQPTATAAAIFWSACSSAFREFPYHIGTVYSAPLQMGPANPLWPAPTGYAACMVGIPYDDLPAWRSIYPPE